jgi:hypothetical protein
MPQPTRTRLVFVLLLGGAAHALAQDKLLVVDSGPPELPPAISSLAPSGPTAAGPASGSSDPSLIFLPADAEAKLRRPKLLDANEQFYYRHRLELSLETGALFINTPFVFDVFVDGDYSHNPLHYTLVPIFPAIRWTPGNISGPGPLRGNTELTASLSLTAIARGPETAYGAFDLGFRRNFIQRNWRLVPFFEGWLGAGFIDAAEPRGNPYAQGQDFTFTIRMGTGVRYNINERFGASLAASYMHVSNAYLSEPRYDDNGINVVGPVIAVYMRLDKHRKK